MDKVGNQGREIKNRAMNYEKTMCLFYSRVTGTDTEGIEQIPPDVLTFLSALDCRDMKKPLIVEQLKSGKSEGQICIHVGVDRMVVRWIKRKFRL